MLNVVAQIASNPDATQAQSEIAQFANEHPILAAIAFKAVAGTFLVVIGGWFALLVSII